MSKSKKKPTNLEPRIANRRAKFDYAVTDKLECGIQLMGSEVKSVRLGQVSLAEGYAAVDPKTMTLTLHGVDIAHYPQAGPLQHETKRTRRLLAHRREIERLFGKTSAKGTTLIPLAMYFVRGRVKVELGVGTGKRQSDKRQDMKKRDADREIRQAMTRKIIG
ncbi:MAG: SsrA-binding protein SmpB [Planctomycetota bacterium]